MEPPTKMPRLEIPADIFSSPQEKSEEEPDFSMLPTEMLLEIFGYLKKEDACVKNLTATCSKFNQILQSRLVLDLDITKNHGLTELPQFRRQYKEIRVYGQIDPKKLSGIFSNSSSSVRRLHLRCIGIKYPRPLMEIFEMLPQLESLTLRCTIIAVPKYVDRIRVDEGPVLNHLKTVDVRNCNDRIFQCFWNAKNVESIKIRTYRLAHRNEIRCDNFMTFLTKQNRLHTLDTDTLSEKSFGLPNLKNLTLGLVFQREKTIKCRLIGDSPSLEKLNFLFLPFAPGNFEFLAGLKSSSLRTLALNINAAHLPTARNILEKKKQENLPSLKNLQTLCGSLVFEL